MRILCLALVLVAAGLARPVAAQPATPLQVPRIAYTDRLLDNGARILAIRDPAAPMASVNVWYRVGQRDDPQARGGFAHLFEHLMFKTTRNLPEGVTPFVTAIGGETNASTLFDYTAYYMTAPANQLEALLWVEGERLRSLVIDEAAFRSERDVVKEELRQRILAQPYGRILYTLLPAFTFARHPYARPIGGTIEDLDQATLADVRDFHEAYYRPDNAIFVISGNFDPAQLDTWVDRYIGSIARPKRAIPRDNASETGPLAARTVNAFAPNVPLPAIIFSWRAPPADHEDVAAMTVIEALLARGPTARLRRQLVDEQQLASSVTAFNLPARDGHAFALSVTLAQGRALDEAESGIAGEIARLRDQLADAEEFASVRNAVLGDALQRRELPRGRAFELGDAVALTGDPRVADRRIEAIRALTPTDLQRVARRWLADDRRVIVRYQDQSARAGIEPDVPADISALGTIVPPATRPAVTIAAEEARETPPAPAPAVRRTIPAITEQHLGNGLRVVAAQSSLVPLVTLKLVLGGGDSTDPTGRAGLADIMAALALRGAGGRDAAAIALQIASLGGTLAATATPDATIFTLAVPAEHAEASGRILADIARRPNFELSELDNVRRQQVDALAVAARQPMQAGMRVLSSAIFAETAYGAIPTSETLARIDAGDIAATFRQWWTPANATLIVTGSLSADQVLAISERLFGDWQKEGHRFAPAGTTGTAAPRVLALDIPSSGQTAVLAAVPVIGHADPQWPALRLANARLGHGRQSLLSQEIRVRRGLSYGAGSLLDERRGAALVIAATQTRNDAAGEVVGIFLDQMRRLSETPMDSAEIDSRAAFLTNMLGSQTERTGGLADYLASLVATGLPLEAAEAELAGSPPSEAAEIRAVAAQYFRPDRATIVVAGDAAVWMEDLLRRFPQARRVTPDGIPDGSAR